MQPIRARGRVALWLSASTLVAVTLVLLVRSRAPRLKVLAFGGEGPPTMILLHGYGSSARRWEPFTHTISLPPQGRFLFPDAPEATVPPDGPVDGCAWWRIDLASYIRPGATVPDLSSARPAGLAEAAKLVRRVLDDAPRGKVVLGGFSQGAMVASEVTFMSDATVDALVVLSGTLVDEATWSARFSRRRDLRVFMSHGRADTILPFQVAEQFRAKLEAAGLAVTWCPFDGGHEIPSEVIVALNVFLRTQLLPN